MEGRCGKSARSSREIKPPSEVAKEALSLHSNYIIQVGVEDGLSLPTHNS